MGQAEPAQPRKSWSGRERMVRSSCADDELEPLVGLPGDMRQERDVPSSVLHGVPERSFAPVGEVPGQAELYRAPPLAVAFLHGHPRQGTGEPPRRNAETPSRRPQVSRARTGSSARGTPAQGTCQPIGPIRQGRSRIPCFPDPWLRSVTRWPGAILGWAANRAAQRSAGVPTPAGHSPYTGPPEAT
jgi:hypothetical protein